MVSISELPLPATPLYPTPPPLPKAIIDVFLNLFSYDYIMELFWSH